MIGAFMKFDARLAVFTLDAYAKFLPRTLLMGMKSYVLRLTRYVVTRKLSGPGGKTDTLNRDTGTAIRSTAASPRTSLSPERVLGSVGARPEYVAKHERGGTYVEHVPAHERRLSRVQKRAERRRQRTAGLGSFGIATVLRAYRIRVRAHSRTVTYRARRMFRSSLRETAALARASFRKAMRVLFATGKPPKMSDLERLNVGDFGAN